VRIVWSSDKIERKVEYAGRAEGARRAATLAADCAQGCCTSADISANTVRTMPVFRPQRTDDCACCAFILPASFPNL
jgi:hypothetical protein